MEFDQDSSEVPVTQEDSQGTLFKDMLQLANNRINDLITNGISTEANLITQVGALQHKNDALQKSIDEYEQLNGKEFDRIKEESDKKVKELLDKQESQKINAIKVETEKNLSALRKADQDKIAAIKIETEKTNIA